MVGDPSLYIGLLLAGYAVYLFISTILATQVESNALSWASGSEPVQSKSGFINFSRPLVHRFTLTQAAKIKFVRYRKNIAKKISTAGLEQELNVDEFIGLQILWGVVFPLLLAFLNFTLEFGFSIPFIIIFGAAGGYFPFLHLSNATKARYSAIIADLPFFIDLLALSTEAGLDFVAAVQRITSKAENSVLAQELMKVLKDINLGSARPEAFSKMADRLDMSEITSFVVVLNDSDSQGVSVSKVLKQQSIQMRLDRFTRAEKAGARASQLILVPMLFLILPAVFLIIFGPVVLQFLKGGA